MKTCFKCGTARPLDEFYPHARMRDGHLNKCRSCTKQDVRRHREQKLDDPAWVRQERARGREKAKRLAGARKPTPSRAWREKNPEKARAHALVASALKRRTLVKPDNCQDCKRPAAGRALHAHHEDHGRPLDVAWVCRGCHGLRHRKPETVEAHYA